MICISLAGITFQECIKAISKSDFVEIRIDQLDLSESQLEALYVIKKNTIATCRPGQYPNEKRLSLLIHAINSGVGYIDIEYEAPEQYRKKLIECAHDKNTLIIISYHNYEKTPNIIDLEHIIEQSKHMGADRIKLATMANSKADNARILSLYENHTKLIAFCMGEIGMITRVAAPMLGSEFTYASLNKKLATAPGQLTYDEFLDIYDIIKW